MQNFLNFPAKVKIQSVVIVSLLKSRLKINRKVPFFIHLKRKIDLADILL